MNKQDDISFLLRPKFWVNLQRIRKLDVDKFLFSLDSLVNLSLYDTPLDREVLDEDNNIIDVLVASLFDAFEVEITSSVARHKDGLKSKTLPANGHKHSDFGLSKKMLFTDTDEDYQIKLKQIIDNDVEKNVSAITFDDFCERLATKDYKYDNFLLAYKMFCKNEKPTPNTKPPKTTNEALEDAYKLLNKQTLNKVITNKYDEFEKLDEDDKEIMTDLIADCSTKLDVNNIEHLKAGYKTLREYCKKKENIYPSTVGKSKREPDKDTKLMHFLKNFWDDYDKKKFTFNGQECYVNGNSLEIVLNKSRMKKPIEHENDIMTAIFEGGVDFE